MTRGKKEEKELTIEERLEQALVPVEEQPYRVPENWCWVRLSTMAKTISKGTTPSGGKSTYTDVGVPFLRVENINDDGTISHRDIMHISEETHFHMLKRSILEKGDILISIAGTLAKTGIVRNIDLPLNTNQAIAFVRLFNIGISQKYIKYSIDSPIIKKELLKKTKVTSIPNLTLKIICNCAIPIAPLAEQQRITDRIESLFAKLNDAKEKAQAAVDGFEICKAAILHRAFTGELTAKWRKEKDITLDSWRNSTIESLCYSLKYGTAKKSHDHGKVIVVRMGNLQNGEIDWSNLAYTDDIDDIEKYKLSPGDILFNRTNSSDLVGKTSIYRGQLPAIYAGYLIKLDYNRNCILGDYLNYVLNSTDAKRYCNLVKADGVNQSNINAKKIGAFIVPVPTLHEQAEIVTILNSAFVKERQAKETAEAVLDQIEDMKKSILARAFRGELGTNDPTEESVVELLKRVI